VAVVDTNPIRPSVNVEANTVGRTYTTRRLLERREEYTEGRRSRCGVIDVRA
jgi:hypothetical protein